MADIDECHSKHDVCGDWKICLNNPGSYSCGCPSGYNGDGVVCDGTYGWNKTLRLNQLITCHLITDIANLRVSMHRNMIFRYK